MELTGAKLIAILNGHNRRFLSFIPNFCLKYYKSTIPQSCFLTANEEKLNWIQLLTDNDLIQTCQISVFLNFDWGLRFSLSSVLHVKVTETSLHLNVRYKMFSICSQKMRLKTYASHTCLGHGTGRWRHRRLSLNDANRRSTKVLFWYHPQNLSTLKLALCAPSPPPRNTPTQTLLPPPLQSPPLQSKAPFVNLMCFYQLLSASETSAVCNQSILWGQFKAASSLSVSA